MMAVMKKLVGLVCGVVLLVAPLAQAQETVCARVKIEIKQELTLERQAFDAEMKINNTTESGVIENVSVVVKVTDEAGTPVLISGDGNDLSAKFFIRISNKENIAAVDGTGAVNPKTTAAINWLLIPAPGSAGINPAGKKYLVGATLKYKFGGEEQTLEVSPDVITVKPLPLLTLDYFLTRNVEADDPLTAEIEPVVPFTLGVRVKNNGFAAAKNLKIDSAQPKIVPNGNQQGLLINFLLTGSYVDDAPAQNTLLINFGDIAAGKSKMGRWNMETSLSGTFDEFTARFSHADELGGAMTSILQATNAHSLIRDVRVDLPGRDLVRDFLAQDGDVIRVYESDGPDTEVLDRSAVAQLTAGASGGTTANFQLVFPATAGFAYVKLRDPFLGQKVLGKIMRSDAKAMASENVWLSRTRNHDTKQWEYWVNFFDVNTTGAYEAEFQAPPLGVRPPVMQFIPDRVTKEDKQVSFLVEASSPEGKPVNLSAAPLPSGATLVMQAADPAAPGLYRAVFDWTPAKGAAGNYLITYTAFDGLLSTTRSASIKVDNSSPPPGPATPTIDSPISGGQVTSLKPTLGVLTSSDALDPTVQVQFELYQDAAMTQLIDSSLVAKAAAGGGNGAGAVVQATTWQPASSLTDNTMYWWRARGFDGMATYSLWANGRFFANTFNDPPDSFNLTNPVPGAEVASLTPTLAWTNSVDKDGDAISYSVLVYSDAALTTVFAQAADLTPDASGSTSWAVPLPLTNHAKYYWRAVAKDALGAVTPTPVRPFTVNTGNTAPTSPVIASPAVGGQSTAAIAVLGIQNSTDAENDLLTYVFEIDTVNTFDSGDKRTSGQVIQSAGQLTQWTVNALVENKHYFWRVKAQDGRAESAWVQGDFLMNAVNDAPPAPTVKNPGNAAWVATQQPSLEANPVLDPEGAAVSYQFEIYRDAALSNKALDGVSSNTGWIVPAQLADKSTYWWRVRALDAQSAASAWSPATVMFVSTAPYQEPSIQLVSPVSPVQPLLDAATNRKLVTIKWEGTDPNIEPTIALYYDKTRSGYAGTLIVDGLRQPAGAQTGSYVWDVTDLPTGAYYVYAVIYNARSAGKAYAPGAVVMVPAAQTGKLTIMPNALLPTTEDGGSSKFAVMLSSKPVADVVIPLSSNRPREVGLNPPSLSFTTRNWNIPQWVTMTGKADCMRDGNTYHQIQVGGVITLDPQYMGVTGEPVRVVNAESQYGLNYAANNSRFAVCALRMVGERKVDATTWEYQLEATIGNTGNAVAGVSAQLVTGPFVMQPVGAPLEFGAMQQGDAGRSMNAITVRTKAPLTQTYFQTGVGMRWSVTTR